MLTASAAINAKPRDRAYKLADSHGLFLLVTPSGSKLWRLKYRRPGAKTENLLSLGGFPLVSLREARDRRDEARKLLDDGIDPGIKRQDRKSVV